MKKGLLLGLAMVLVMALVGPALAADYIFVDETPAYSLGPDVFMANIKVKRGPFGGGFFGTDCGWVLYQKNPATLEKKILASGNGRFDGTNIAAAAVGGAVLGGTQIGAASLIRNTVEGGNAVAKSRSYSKSSSRADADARNTNINIDINGGIHER